MLAASRRAGKAKRAHPTLACKGPWESFAESLNRLYMGLIHSCSTGA